MAARPSIRASLSTNQSLFAGTLRSITFDVEIKGSGASGTPPEIGEALRAAGFGETIVAATSVTYAPASTGLKSCSIYHYLDGTLYKLTGSVGDVNFKLAKGGKGMASFTFTGHSVAPTDSAIITPTLDATVPPVLLGLSFAIGGYAANIESLNFSMGNVVSKPPSINAADGFSQLLITQRDVNGTFNPEHTLVATRDWEGVFRAGTTGTIATGTIGTAAGNRYAVSMPKVYTRNLTLGDREGVRTLDNAFGASINTGDDEVSIAFT